MQLPDAPRVHARMASVHASVHNAPRVPQAASRVATQRPSSQRKPAGHPSSGHARATGSQGSAEHAVHRKRKTHGRKYTQPIQRVAAVASWFPESRLTMRPHYSRCSTNERLVPSERLPNGDPNNSIPLGSRITTSEPRQPACPRYGLEACDGNPRRSSVHSADR